MEPQLRWLQLSDLHFKAEHDFTSRQVRESLYALVKREQKFDLIFVTGDIAFSGREEEYKRAEEYFDKLLESAGLGKERFFIVPGNHDVDRRRGMWLRGTLSSTEDSHAFFSALMDDSNRVFHQHKMRAFDDFHDGYFRSLPDRLISRNRSGTCGPVSNLDLGTYKVSILPVNTALFAQDDHDDTHKMWIGHPCIARAVEQLAADAHFRIALMHHPRSSLNQADAAYREMCKAVDFVLFGHTHEQSLDWSIDKISDSQVLNCNSGSVFSSYRQRNSVVAAQADLEHVSFRTYVYSKERSEWAVDSAMFDALEKTVSISGLGLRRGSSSQASAPPAAEQKTAADSHERLDLASLSVDQVKAMGIEAIIVDITRLSRPNLAKLLATHKNQSLSGALSAFWPTPNTMGYFTTAKAMRLGLYGTIAGVLSRQRNTAVSWQDVRERLENQHGKTHIRTVFLSEWPATTDEGPAHDTDGEDEEEEEDLQPLGKMTANQARQRGFQEKISNVTGLKISSVDSRLKGVHGKSLVANVFKSWPSSQDLMEYTVSQILRLSLVGDLAGALGRDTREVNTRLRDLGGKTLIKNLEWDSRP